MSSSRISHMQPVKTAESLAHAPQKVQSEALLGNARELLIVHNGREYRLRLTQNGKLILTA
jgi:hemin uptake protein HemP